MAGQRPSDLEAHLGYWLRTVSNAVSYSFAGKVGQAGVTVAEWVFLRVLYDTGRIAPSLLAERIGMTRGAISKLADRLIDKKLVQRRADPGDRRAHTLALTRSGRALVPKLAVLADRNDAAFFGVLTAGERDQLERLLRKIVSVHELRSMPTDQAGNTTNLLTKGQHHG